jgi:Ca2+-binding RTX toxin-like protein
MADKVGGEFVVNSTSQERQVTPSVTDLEDGGFVVVWQALSDLRDGDYAILGQAYNADGTRRGQEFVVNSTTEGDQTRPSVTALSDGGYVVAWTDDSSTGGDTSRDAVRGQAYEADGSTRGGEFLVNTTTLGGQGEPSALGLSDGGFVVVWEDLSGTDGDTGGAIRGQVFNADGTQRGGEILVNTSLTGTQRNPSLTELPNGDFVVTWVDWQSNSISTADLVIRGQAFTPDGVPRRDEFLVESETGEFQSDPSVAGLSNGGFVVVWEDADNFGDVRAQIYAADGSPSGDEFRANTTTSSSQRDPSVTGLADGGFLVTWEDSSATGGDTSSTAIRAQAYTADGTARGENFLVNTTTEFEQNDPNVTSLPNGGFVVAWEDGSSEPTGSLEAKIRAQIFEAPDAPASPVAGQTLVGTPGDDTLEGGAGDDILRGLDGRDRLIGGDGNDRIEGGETDRDRRDLIFAGAGDDVADGGYGSDQLNGGSGNDTLAGGFGADDVRGNAGDDTITGSAFSDLLFGGPGFDFVNGGFGFDRVNGGDGGDRFFHTGDRGHASDWIQDYDATEGDVLLYGSQATRSDFRVITTDTPNAGQTGVEEAFVVHDSGQILWALVDGSAQNSISVRTIGGTEFDLFP